MAERERLTKKERRERSREERKRKEAEAARRRKRNQLRNSLVTLVIVAVVAAVLLQAFFSGPDELDEAVLVSAEEADAAREAAGCEVLVERQPLPEAYHFDSAEQAPALETIYPDIRPTHSGPHTAQTHPIIPDGASRQLDEVVVTHNLEHGAIFAWYDPEQVDGSTASEMGDWSETLNASGFRFDRGGVGIFVAPYEDPGISSGKPVAFRAWGTAMDCDEWDETVANAFVIEHFGTRGIAPEQILAPYPTEVLDYADRQVEETDTPQGDPDHIEDEGADDAEDAGDDTEDTGDDEG